MATKCDKCLKVYEDDETVNLVHDRDDDNTVRRLCEVCQRHPEYHTQCPHCEAYILIN